MTPNYDTREIETTGRYQCITSVEAIIYPRSIVATSDSDHITPQQMHQALRREFPRHTFTFNGLGGSYTLRADASRFPNDGL